MNDDDDSLPAEVASDPSNSLRALGTSMRETGSKEWAKLSVGERIAEIQANLASRSAVILDDALSFAEVDPNDESPPQRWVEELGEERAIEKFRVAKASHLNSKAAPSGISVAKAIFVAMAKLQASQNQQARPPVSPVQVTITIPSYDEIEVE